VRKRSIAVVTTLAVAILAFIAWFALDTSARNRGAPSTMPSQTQVLSYDGYVAEYRLALGTLTWPSGATPNPDPMNADRSANYEAGSGEGDAVARWQCAWSGDYLTHRASNPQAAQKALEVYGSIQTLPAWKRAYSDPNTRAVILDSLSKARLGDPSLIQQIYRANC
jgi:hypothetical protein